MKQRWIREEASRLAKVAVEAALIRSGQQLSSINFDVQVKRYARRKDISLLAKANVEEMMSWNTEL